jgi:hypothetical protein
MRWRCQLLPFFSKPFIGAQGAVTKRLPYTLSDACPSSEKIPNGKIVCRFFLLELRRFGVLNKKIKRARSCFTMI